MTCVTLTLNPVNAGISGKENDDEHFQNNVRVQSPIAIKKTDCKLASSAVPLKFDGHWSTSGKAYVSNTGSTVFIQLGDLPKTPTITGGPLKDVYVLEQIHFHWSNDDVTGSEHAINGKRYSMEVHAVHYNKKYGSFESAFQKTDGLAVVGHVLDSSVFDNALFAPLVNAVDQVKISNTTVTINADCLRWLEAPALPSQYFTYKGSLTTPPYSESVTWIVYEEPIKVSKAQIEAFRHLESSVQSESIKNNVRPLQNNNSECDCGVVFVQTHKSQSKL